jgi:hypothetical protein
MAARDPQDDDVLRMEIQAAIAAGREVGPEMDTHLADSVLERYRQEQAARQAAIQAMRPAAAVRQPRLLAPKPQQSAETVGRTILAIAGLAVVVGLLFWQPHFWWILFFLPGLFGFWGRGRRRSRWDRYRHQDLHFDDRDVRYEESQTLPQSRIDMV